MSRTRDSADILSNQQQATTWCTFDGTLTGTNAPVGGYGITSVERVSAGQYKLTFDTVMDNLNYTLSGIGSTQAALTGAFLLSNELNVARTLNDVNIITVNASGAPGDNNYISLQIFGGKN